MFDLLHSLFIRFKEIFNLLWFIFFECKWLKRGVEILNFWVFKPSGIEINRKLFYNPFGYFNILFCYLWLLSCEDTFWISDVISVGEENKLEARRCLEAIFLVNLLRLRYQGAKANHADWLWLESGNSYRVICLHRFNKRIEYFTRSLDSLFIRIQEVTGSDVVISL